MSLRNSGTETEKRKRVQIQNTLEEKKLQRQLNLYTKEQRYVDKELQRIVQAKRSLMEGLEQLNQVSPKQIMRRRSISGASPTSEDVSAERRSKSAENILRETSGAEPSCGRRENKVHRTWANIQQRDFATSAVLSKRKLKVGYREANNFSSSKSTSELARRFPNSHMNTKFDRPSYSVPQSPITKHASLPKIEKTQLVRNASGGLIAHSFSSRVCRDSTAGRFRAASQSPSSSAIGRKMTPPVANKPRSSPPDGKANSSGMCPKSEGRFYCLSSGSSHGFNSNTDMLDVINLKSKFRQIGSVVLASKLIRCTLDRKKMQAKRTVKKECQ